MAKRSVQAYIEEVPCWEGGARLAGPPLSGMQWLVWSLATAGKFFEGLIVFMGGVALPLISEQFAMTSTDKGLVTAATLAGILVGALALGDLLIGLAASRCSSVRWCCWRWPWWPLL